MTARIARMFEFQAGVQFADEFFMNTYSMDVQFNVETESIREQNIALERIKYFLNEQLEHSVLCIGTEEAQIAKFLDAGLKVCTLPEEPYDQIIGIMILSKINAITEGKLVATDITISSRMSDEVSCLYSIEENAGPFLLKGWWKDSSPSINDITPKPSSKKIVKLNKPKSNWDDMALGWEEAIIVSKEFSNAEIVFASFENKTDK